MQELSVTILIPAFNEEAAVGEVVRSLRASYPRYEIIVVDDGSTDRTSVVAQDAGATVIRLPRNRGYGAAIKAGALQVKSDAVVWFDADGQFDSKDIERMIHILGSKPCDLVAGARVSGSHVPLVRRPGKFVLKRLANFLTEMKMPDVNCGFRAFRTDLLVQHLSLLPNSFSASLTSTVLFGKLGYAVEFLPIRISKRIGGGSSVRQVRDGSATVLLALRLVTLFDPLRIFLPPAIFLMVFSAVYSLYEAVTKGLGVPVLGATGFLVGCVIFFLGLMCDQLSALRIDLVRHRRLVDSVSTSKQVLR